MFPYRLAIAAAALSLAGPGPLIARTAESPPAQTITLTSYKFSPSPLRLVAGQAVTLNFVNHAGKSHDFTAPLFFARARILSGAAPGGEIELKGGARISITLVPAAGTYMVHCSHFLHSALGMHAQIIVN